MGLHTEVFNRIQRNPEALCFTNVIGNLMWEQIVMAETKSICSHVRNTFRESVSLLIQAPISLASNSL